MIESVLGLLLSIMALAAAAAAVWAPNRSHGALALGACALCVALLCALHGQAQAGASIALLFAGGLGTAGLVLVRACGAQLPCLPGRRRSHWAGLCVAGLLLAALAWTLPIPASLGQSTAAGGAVADHRVGSQWTVAVLTALLLCVSLVFIVMLTRRPAAAVASLQEE